MICGTEPFITDPDGITHAHTCDGEDGHGTTSPHHCGECDYEWLTSEYSGAGK